MARKAAPPPAKFDDWTRCLFRRPAELCVIHDAGMPDFLERDAAYTFSADPAETLALFVHTLRNIPAIAAGCTVEQAAFGLNTIFNGSYSNISHAILTAAAASPADRLAAIRSIYDLYAGYLRHASAPVLGHLSERASDLDTFTYMLWDVTPLASWAGVRGKGRDDYPLLTVLERVLRIPHDGCIESALHGLGHMAGRERREVVAGVVDRFLRDTPGLRAELRQYAERARVGRVL